MAITIESSVWEPNPFTYIFLFFSCCFLIFLFPHISISNRTSTIFDHGISSSFLRFQLKFLLLYSLSSVMEGLWLAFGEFELASYGVGREQMETGVLVTLFILFHACVGLILPSLARLRTMYVPNEFRGGMVGLSLAPANVAILLSFVQE
ncbi:hypothetical protein K1719_040255 [Acacia pycnantha]|nr:hypothetical protein K1719_040255 [Acacia pycnantha]